MISRPEPTRKILKKFDVSTPVFAAESPLAVVWKVQRRNGFAALKCYHDGDTKNEWPGFALIDALDGAGVVQVYQYDDGVALMEWLDGPSLGDLARSGHDTKAAEILADVAGQIHAKSALLSQTLPRVEETFHALFSLVSPADVDDRVRENIHQSIGLAHRLLATEAEQIALHGDLHHDNVKRTMSGYKAFDAKGEIGPRAYEFANSFRNPLGAPHLVNDPARAAQMAQIWGASSDTPPNTMLQWAAARAALSLAWSQDLGDTDDSRMLAMLLELLGAP